jgi:hypothetical protein
MLRRAGAPIRPPWPDSWRGYDLNRAAHTFLPKVATRPPTEAAAKLISMIAPMPRSLQRENSLTGSSTAFSRLWVASAVSCRRNANSRSDDGAGKGNSLWPRHPGSCPRREDDARDRGSGATTRGGGADTNRSPKKPQLPVIPLPDGRVLTPTGRSSFVSSTSSAWMKSLSGGTVRASSKMRAPMSLPPITGQGAQ